MVFQSRKQVDDRAGGKGNLSALSRVAFEKHMSDARHHAQVALRKQISFWGELSEAVPDITRCHRLSTQLNRATAAAEEAFRQLLELNAQSLLALRMYAEFTMVRGRGHIELACCCVYLRVSLRVHTACASSRTAITPCAVRRQQPREGRHHAGGGRAY